MYYYINKTMDLFDHYDTLPPKVKKILDKFGDNTYDSCSKLVARLNKVGYTCDYYLDAEPYNLRVLNCPVCKSDDTRDDLDSPETMNCCNKCGADFMNDGEVILDPTKI
jgi:hypothetical protein